MIKAGQMGTRAGRAMPGNYELATTQGVNRLAEMCALFAWRRHCKVTEIAVANDERFGFLTARFSIEKVAYVYA